MQKIGQVFGIENEYNQKLIRNQFLQYFQWELLEWENHIIINKLLYQHLKIIIMK